MYETILVPLDGSDLAECALEPALELVKQAHGELILLSVPVMKHMFVADSAGYGLLLPDDSYLDSRREMATYLEKIQAEHADPEFSLRTMIVSGDVASVIVDTAAEQDVDLIVISTHGRTGLTRWMLGSITEKVMRNAHCSVLVCRSPGRKSLKN